MDRALTRGQPVALAAIEAILAGGGSHAILFAGPGGVGKTTLALDLAAALLCTAPEGRPCRACRGCRLVNGGNHPDLHRLAPEGPGGQIRIGERNDPDPGTVRRLIADLALLPVEGGARVAIVEQAHRLNDDAQSALLKTLEEPPTGVTIVLCTDDEERLLPTIRSRCARVRLGPVGLRDIEALLGERGLADAPTAARLGRISQGRPGLAIAWASDPEAILTRDAIARQLLDLLAVGRAPRLTAARGLLDAGGSILPPDAPARPRATTPKSRRGRAPSPQPEPAGDPADEDGAGPTRRTPVGERRLAVAHLIELWRDLARDLAVVGIGDVVAVRDPALLDELASAASRLPPGAAAAFLDGLSRAGELLESNVGPDLILDQLLLAWPHAIGAVDAG